MKLKDLTFAIIAEKKDSISNKWFVENLSKNSMTPSWEIGVCYYYENGYYNKRYRLIYVNRNHRNLYTESEFEALLKAEELSEICETSKLQPMIGNSSSTGENAQTLPKNTVFGKENFAKPFKGFTLTKSEAEKILRDKFKLPDYVEFKIVE